MRLSKGWIAGILAAVLNACVSPTQPNTPTVTATIGGSGGRVEATSSGAVVALEFPAGAVKQNLEVKLTPLAPNPETLAGFRVEPGGTFLHQPVALKFTSRQLPVGASFFWKVGGSRRAFPTTRNGDTLSAQIRSLGYQAQQGQVRSLAEGDGNLEVAVLDCAERIPQAQQQLRAVINSGDFAQATVLLNELEAIELACQLLEIAALQQAACQEYMGAEQTARVIAADTYQTFRQLVVSLLAGEASVRLTGAECNTSGFSSLFDAKLNQFLDFLEADYSRPSFAQEFNQAAARVRELLQYEASCQAMTNSGPVCARFSSQLYPPMLDKLRRAAYRMCLQGDLLTLSQMHNQTLPRTVIGQPLGAQSAPTQTYLNYATYTYGDLEVDLAHCQSSLNVKVYEGATTVPVEIVDQRRTLEGGNQPGSHTTSATVQVPQNGSLTIGGTVKALVCPDGSLSNDALVFRVGNTTLAQRPRNGDRFSLDTAPADLVVERVLSAAGLPATTNSFTVEVFREGAACEGLFSNSLKLYTINVKKADGEASLTFTETRTTHKKEGGPGQDYEATINTVITRQGSVQLRKKSETATGIIFEIVGGTVNGTEKHDEIRRLRGEISGSCYYNVTITVHQVISGSAAAIGSARVSFGPGNTYLINSDPQNLSASGQVTENHKYDNLSDSKDCRTDGTYVEQVTYNFPIFLYANGTLDPNNPKVLSGTVSEDIGNGTIRTLTWTMSLE